jgi:DNA topoisomerase VI subunit B
MNKINLIKKENEVHYKLSSEYTIYAQFHKVNSLSINLKQLNTKRKQLKKLLREKKVKVSTKTNDEIFKIYSEDFYTKLSEYKTISEELIKRFNSIYEKGLSAPTSDNIELIDAEHLYYKLQKLTSRNSALSVFQEINTQINDIQKDLDLGVQFIRVAI